MNTKHGPSLMLSVWTFRTRDQLLLVSWDTVTDITKKISGYIGVVELNLK